MSGKTMTIHVSAELDAKLDRLADDTRRSKTLLAGEAVSAFVDRELEIIDGIKRGLADVEAGRVVPHDEVMAQAREIVADARKSKQKPME